MSDWSPEATEATARARAALAVLPAVQREAIVLFEIVGWQVDEIAELQRVSASAVKSRSHTLVVGRGDWQRFWCVWCSEPEPIFTDPLHDLAVVIPGILVAAGALGRACTRPRWSGWVRALERSVVRGRAIRKSICVPVNSFKFFLLAMTVTGAEHRDATRARRPRIPTRLESFHPVVSIHRPLRFAVATAALDDALLDADKSPEPEVARRSRQPSSVH